MRSVWLLLLFIVAPAVELYLLVQVGGRIGVLPTLALIFLMGVLGWNVLRHQGASTWRRIQSELQAGRMPAREVVSGLCLFAAGILLITPGFLTDVVGLLLLVPPIRNLVAGLIARRLAPRMVVVGPAGPMSPRGRGQVIDLPPDSVQEAGPSAAPHGAP